MDRDKICILVVDDDADVRRGSTRVLEQAGFAVTVAPGGAEALQAMRVRVPNLVLLDWDMPGMDGMEVCRRIKAAPELAGVLVILISGNYTDSDEQADGMGIGADGFIARPIGNRELVARIASFGRIWRLSQALREKNAELIALNERLHRHRLADLNLLEDAAAARHRAETMLKALRESEDIFTKFMEYSPIYVFFKDENIRSVRLSKNYETLLKKPLPELLGKTMDDLFPSAIAKSMVADDMRVLQEGKVVNVDEELNGRTYTTIKFPIAVEGKPRFLAGFTIDTTERKQAEREISRLNDVLEERVRERTAQLQAANAELQQFAYVASHDLQEPLRMVTSYIQLLEKRLKGKLDDDSVEFMHFAVDGAQRMSRLIQEILTYSRIGTRGRPLVEVNSAAALQEAQRLLAGAISESGAEISSPAMPVVMADRTQLVQLFQNLIGNAIKFCAKRPPQVLIEARREVRKSRGWWRFSVTDNGIGIAPEYREQIFVIFKRLHTQREYSGTGIGLALCKRIVERHGGEIGIEAAEGGGSVFWFTLPEEHTL